ncbi:hypothetical protein BDQ17DRAFT_1435496 [Cyathus striatus]|nr:hypothetical protein BDQ17DRAFT_1435496 [Cyathus striatus]
MKSAEQIERKSNDQIPIGHHPAYTNTHNTYIWWMTNYNHAPNSSPTALDIPTLRTQNAKYPHSNILCVTSISTPSYVRREDEVRERERRGGWEDGGKKSKERRRGRAGDVEGRDEGVKAVKEDVESTKMKKEETEKQHATHDQGYRAHHSPPTPSAHQQPQPPYTIVTIPKQFYERAQPPQNHIKNTYTPRPNRPHRGSAGP